MLRRLVSSGVRARQQIEKPACLAPQAITRGFADGAVAEQEERDFSPPVPVHGIAGRYAAALYMSGASAGLLDEIDCDLTAIGQAALQSEDLRNFLKDPSIPKGSKQEALDAILDGLECEDLTKNFFGLLNENNRLSEFMKISTTYEELVAAARGEVRATITTAEALEESELDEIRDSLDALLEPGQTLLVQEKIDPSIIGGVVIDIGDKHMDLSISSRIKRIQQMVLDTV